MRFLTMGARGVHQAMAQLQAAGFKPIELERYCGSNKIWTKKIKRLRLPDLLCVKTGLRIEVRAKSDLTIKMSDAPLNPDRSWDAGLKDDDLAAFIACHDHGDGPVPAERAMFIRVGDMRRSLADSKLGAAKSASEGAERDRTWPATVPKRAGEVLQVNAQKIVVRQFATADKPERQQTYQLKGKNPYVQAGDRFEASASFIAGAPERLADFKTYLGRVFEPFDDLGSSDPALRYAAVKSFPHRSDDSQRVKSSLEQVIGSERELRVKLEAAGSASFFGSSLGEDTLSQLVWDEHMDIGFKMEAILILVELGTGLFSRRLLKEVASHGGFAHSEIRQAAIWGLGKAGFKDYDALLPYIADHEENVALHAIAAFGSDCPEPVIDALLGLLFSQDIKLAPAASEALRSVGSVRAVRRLCQAYETNPASRLWIIATLGRMSPKLVTPLVTNPTLLDCLAPMFLWAESCHWLSSERIQRDIAFLHKQNL